MRKPTAIRPPSSPADVFDLTGRTALVTGASSGLGHRMALVLAHAGATVAVTARRTARLESLAGEHPSIHPFVADLTDADSRQDLVGRVENEFGSLDILVNNAGLANPKPIEQESLEDFEAMIEINLTAAWHLSKLFGVGMVSQGSGSIINIASMLGVVGATPSKQTGYPAAKAGLVSRRLIVQPVSFAAVPAFPGALRAPGPPPPASCLTVVFIGSLRAGLARGGSCAQFAPELRAALPDRCGVAAVVGARSGGARRQVSRPWQTACSARSRPRRAILYRAPKPAPSGAAAVETRPTPPAPTAAAESRSPRGTAPRDPRQIPPGQ